jgi:hypothetical protein
MAEMELLRLATGAFGLARDRNILARSNEGRIKLELVDTCPTLLAGP